jgi:hypothetical protein
MCSVEGTFTPTTRRCQSWIPVVAVLEPDTYGLTFAMNAAGAVNSHRQFGLSTRRVAAGNIPVGTSAIIKASYIAMHMRGSTSF